MWRTVPTIFLDFPSPTPHHRRRRQMLQDHRDSCPQGRCSVQQTESTPGRPRRLCRRKRHPDPPTQPLHFLQQINTLPLDTSPQPRYWFLNMDRQAETRFSMISPQPGRKNGCLNPFGPFPLAGERASFLPKRASAPQATPSPSPMKTADQRPTDTQPTASRDDIGPGIAQPAYRPAADQVNPRGAAPALSVNRSVSAAFS